MKFCFVDDLELSIHGETLGGRNIFIRPQGIKCSFYKKWNLLIISKQKCAPSALSRKRLRANINRNVLQCDYRTQSLTPNVSVSYLIFH